MCREQVIPKKIRGIKALIAEGSELDFHIKELEGRLDTIKKMVRQHAAYREENQLFGDYNTGVVIESMSSAEIDPVALKVEVNDDDAFYGLIKANLKACREFLGEERFMEVADIEEFPYSRVTFGEVVAVGNGNGDGK